MSYYCIFFGCELYCPAHQRSMFAEGEICIAYLHIYTSICMACIFFCKSYMSCYMFVGGELYLIALPHTIPHMVSKKSNMYGVAPVTLMHVSRRVR